uniref:Photosystem I assembly protein Ycf4 n=1 Tax=Crouania attenuata TaxID=42002 RepID=A0A4D6WSV9_9FLOR|nr:photosystem I assembly protein Ycf4 [Crouania attenuata]
MSNIKTDNIVGSRRFSNYWWATIIFLGGLGFFTVGISSYLQTILVIPFEYENLMFIPQGVIMTFYGTTGILVSLFLWLTIIWNVGSGYNEFNKRTKTITIYRQGFPGKNRILKLKYDIKQIQSIKIDIKEGLNPKREIYLKTKDQREIPLTNIDQPLLLSELEQKAGQIAKFLDVSLEGLDKN